jgi:Xaa-Pro aminopeptidase/Xaa-Pro dipeptidase
MNALNKLKTSIDLQLDQAFVIFSPVNITYISSFNGHAATLLLTSNKCYLITDYRYFEQAKSQATGFEIICRDRTKQSLGQLLNQLLEQNSISNLYFEADHISYSQWQGLKQDLSITKTLPITRTIEDLRYFKSELEIKNIQKAANIADNALENTLSLVKENVTERELATELEYQMSLLGSEEMSFPTILVFAERSALPHGIPGNRKLKNGDLILIDFGAVHKGYRSDMTRTYVFGKANKQQKEIHKIVANAQQKAIDAIKIGVSGEYLYRQSEKVLLSSPYAEYMGEGLGHGVGLDLHEFPFMGKNCNLKIQEGCVITVEPGIYIPDWGGVRIEDDIAVTKNGIEILNNSPRELLEL